MFTRHAMRHLPSARWNTLGALALALLGAACRREVATAHVTSAPAPTDAATPRATSAPAPCEELAAMVQMLRDRERFAFDAWTRLEPTEDAIIALHERAARAHGATRTGLEKDLGSLDAERRAVEASLRALPGATDDAWPGARRSIDSALVDLERAVVQAAWASGR
jgi:hypothetical protein